MKKMVCELCSSNEFTKDDSGLFVCDFCRTKYTPEQAKELIVKGTVRIDRSADSESLITLSQRALENSNHEEAISYANRALEIDPSNSSVWFIKGTACGWTSKLNDLHLIEMIGAYKTALEHAPESEKASLAMTCAGNLNEVAMALYSLSLENVQTFAAVEDSWSGHIERCQSIIATLFQSYEWHQNRVPLDNIISVASKLIMGVSFKNFDGASVVNHLSPEGEASMNKVIENAATKLREFDPDYVAPKPVAEKPDACFVVTATMGHENTFPVKILRLYRDDVLVKHKLGRGFISWYYKNGPIIADAIRDDKALRTLSFLVVVAPSAAIAWLTMKANRSRN